jgi:hypothetical protein
LANPFKTVVKRKFAEHADSEGMHVAAGSARLGNHRHRSHQKKGDWENDRYKKDVTGFNFGWCACWCGHRLTDYSFGGEQ